MSRYTFIAVVSHLLMIAASGVHAQTIAASPDTFYGSFKHLPEVGTLTELGRAMFFDASLSASGKISCASCHSPQHAYGPPNDLAVQIGGADLKAAGLRAVPSLRYLQNVPRFTEHFYDSDGDDSVDQGPTGGHTWDGRAFSAHDQARLPLLSSLEMANRSAAEVVDKVSRATYAAQMKEAFGSRVLEDRVAAFSAILLALEVFQQNALEFYPYTSKYDDFLRGKVQLTAQELNGLTLFNSGDKGNCASCHPSSIKGSKFPQFTDYGFAALAVPRNQAIAANSNPKYFDLGLCGPLRIDLKTKHEYCGLFRAPSLRNVALRKRFFHNGAFETLESVIEFYVERDSNPGKFYSTNSVGKVNNYDDLPASFQENINRDPPFNRTNPNAPALSREEIADVIAFLRTLTDGYGATVAKP